MDYVLLNLSFWINCLYRFWEVRQSIHTGNQNIQKTAVFQSVHNRHPFSTNRNGVNTKRWIYFCQGCFLASRSKNANGVLEFHQRTFYNAVLTAYMIFIILCCNMKLPNLPAKILTSHIQPLSLRNWHVLNAGFSFAMFLLLSDYRTYHLPYLSILTPSDLQIFV